MAIIVSKKVSFDSAHHLPNYPGKCSRIHGHTWFLEVGITGPLNKETGMVMDFTDIKRFLDCVKGELDHYDLNEIIEVPTAESICLYVRGKWEGDDWGQGPCSLSFVRVWETPDSMAELRV